MPNNTTIIVIPEDQERLTVGRAVARQRYERMVVLRIIGLLALVLTYFSLVWTARIHGPSFYFGGARATFLYRGPQIFDPVPHVPDYSHWGSAGNWKTHAGVHLGGETSYSAPVGSSDAQAVTGKLWVDCTHITCDGRRVSVLFNDIEIWRFSAPTEGRSFEYTKDLTSIVELLKTDGKISFVSTLDDVETSCECPFDLSLSFFSDRSKKHTLVDPLVANAFLKVDSGDRISVPRNTTAVVADVFAFGEKKDLLWYTNVVDSYSGDDETVERHGPSRTVQIFIDGELAGLTSVIPITASYDAFDPDLWQSIAPIHAHDIPATHVDLTPFLPKLWDGCKIEISVGLGSRNYKNANDADHVWKLGSSLRLLQVSGVEGSTVSDPQVDKSGSLTPIYSGDRHKFSQVLSETSKHTTSSIVDFGDGKHTTLKAVSKYEASNVQSIKSEKRSIVNSVKVTHEAWHNHDLINTQFIKSSVVVSLHESEKVSFVQALTSESNGYKTSHGLVASISEHSKVDSALDEHGPDGYNFYQKLMSRDAVVQGCDSEKMPKAKCERLRFRK